MYTTTGQQPYYAFFSRYAPREVGVILTDVPGEPEGVAIANEILQVTHQKMARKNREVANRRRNIRL